MCVSPPPPSKKPFLGSSNKRNSLTPRTETPACQLYLNTLYLVMPKLQIFVPSSFPRFLPECLLEEEKKNYVVQVERKRLFHPEEIYSIVSL